MTTELQNKVWSILPKEFKEEVKKEYKHQLSIDNEQAYWMLERIFSKHNLTSNAEGEEILIVPRKKVQEMFDKIQKIIPKCEHDRGFRNAGLNILKIFFNSKCLPDRDAHEDNFTKITSRSLS